MLTAKDMKDMIDMYSQFVEDKMITKGRERLIENALGLTGEAGEVSEKIKKLFRDNKIDDDAVLRELGDVLFYTVALSNIFGGSLIKIIELNMEKLNERVKNGTLQGSGDNR
jgi:NTP pyrophosphatase (non-canonical NTP hydrolase)